MCLAIAVGPGQRGDYDDQADDAGDTPEDRRRIDHLKPLRLPPLPDVVFGAGLMVVRLMVGLLGSYQGQSGSLLTQSSLSQLFSCCTGATPGTGCAGMLATANATMAPTISSPKTAARIQTTLLFLKIYLPFFQSKHRRDGRIRLIQHARVPKTTMM